MPKNVLGWHAWATTDASQNNHQIFFNPCNHHQTINDIL